MNKRLVKKLYRWSQAMLSKPDLPFRIFDYRDINEIRNGIIRLSESIAKTDPYFSKDLFRLKDALFIQGNHLNDIAFGAFVAIINYLNDKIENPQEDVWAVMHPRIVKSSKKLYLDGHYANAAEDAFIEINDRIKKLYKKLNPTATKIPDGDAAITTVFSPNKPMVQVCDISTDSGLNEQKGFMFMLQGAMSALRNPKAHKNIYLDENEAFRRLMFASMLMYKIDEGVAYSQIEE